MKRREGVGEAIRTRKDRKEKEGRKRQEKWVERHGNFRIKAKNKVKGKEKRSEQIG